MFLSFHTIFLDFFRIQFQALNVLNYIICNFGTKIYFPLQKKYLKHESYSLQVIRTNRFERAEVIGGGVDGF